MSHLNIKNYRNFKDANFVLSPLVILTGENNTGKTSLLKLIETISNNKTLNFQETFFNEVKTKDILRNKKNPLEILISYTYPIFSVKKSHPLKEVFLFEKYEIFLNNDYDFPVIKKLYTWDNKNNELIVFEFDYIFSNIHQTINSIPKIKSIAIESYNLAIDTGILLKKEPFDFISLINQRINERDVKWKSNKIILSEYLDLKNTKNFHSIHTNFYKYQIFSILDRINTSLSIKDLYALYIFCSNKKEKIDGSTEIEKILDIALEGVKFRTSRYNDFYYIGPIRPMFEEFYVQENFSRLKRTSSNFIQLDSIKNFFENKNDIKEDLNNFFQKISNIQDVDIVEDQSNNNPIVYYYPVYRTKLNSKKEKKLKYSGTGISQLFPIMVNLLSNKAKLDLSKISLIRSIGIEQPELHLHPKAQNELGSFLIDYIEEINNLRDKMDSNNDGELGNKLIVKRNLDSRYIIIETHSTFIVNGMRKSLNKIYRHKLLNKSNENDKATLANEMNFLFLFNKGNTTKIDAFSINKNGRLTGNYKNYLDFYIKDSFEMLGI